MKIAIAKEHRDFFKKNRWIELEDLITESQANQLNENIHQTLSEKLTVPIDKLSFVPREKLFLQGRDLWRSNEAIRKLICQPRMGEIVSELVETKPIRLGYDQFLPSHQEDKFTLEKPTIFTDFIKRANTLHEISCLKGIVAGVFVCLDHPTDLIHSDELDLFPSQPRRVIVVHPELILNLSLLKNHPKQNYYLVVYTSGKAFYYLQENDPHTHSLKKEGYIYNDQLSDKFNPIVFR